MDKLKLEKLYEEEKLYDYRLKNIEELCRIHDIKLNQIEGYTKLTERDKQTFTEFLVNYYNTHEIERRNIISLRVFRALEEEYVIDDLKIKGEIFLVKRIIYKVGFNNKMELVEECIDSEYEEYDSRLGSVFSYLKFVCVENGRHVCIHIRSKNNWY